MIKESGIAGPIGSTLANAAMGSIKFMGRHPFATLAVAGGALIASKATNVLKYPYLYMNEERKRRTQLQQTNILSMIANNQQQKPTSDPQPIIFPLV